VSRSAITTVPPEFFAEGICRTGDHIWQLTWQEGVALRWRTAPLTLLETVPYNREGWGICAAGDWTPGGSPSGTGAIPRRS
jgi:glutamine cyclotransferase